MRVHVRLFASLREAVGKAELDLELPPLATPEDAWRTLASSHPAIAPRRKSLAVAVNRRYAPFSEVLSQGDEVVFMPPVSGG
jgi:molybdopterin converting factor subunit 1